MLYSDSERTFIFNMGTDEKPNDKAFIKRMKRDMDKLEEWKAYYKDIIRDQRRVMKIQQKRISRLEGKKY
jgi:hypothetical protein